MEPRLPSDTAVRKQHYFIVTQSQFNTCCPKCGGHVGNNHRCLLFSLRGLSSAVASRCSSSLFVQTSFSTFQPEAPESTALNIHAAITRFQTPLVTFWDDALVVLGFALSIKKKKVLEAPRTCCSHYPRCLRWAWPVWWQESWGRRSRSWGVRLHGPVTSRGRKDGTLFDLLL